MIWGPKLPSRDPCRLGVATSALVRRLPLLLAAVWAETRLATPRPDPAEASSRTPSPLLRPQVIGTEVLPESGSPSEQRPKPKLFRKVEVLRDSDRSQSLSGGESPSG